MNESSLGEPRDPEPASTERAVPVSRPLNRWVAILMALIFVGIGVAVAAAHHFTDGVAVWALALVFFVGSWFIDRGG